MGQYLWVQAASGGAVAAQRQSGVIAEGRKADWVVLNRELCELSAVQEALLLDSAIFASNVNPVRDVMVNGRWLVKKGYHKEQAQAARDYQLLLKRVAHHGV